MRIVLELRGDWDRERAFKLKNAIEARVDVAKLLEGVDKDVDYRITVLGDDGMEEEQPVATSSS